MGRQAKLKRLRREVSSQPLPLPQPETNLEPTQFVKELEQQGYQLHKIDRCPSLPDSQVNPQL
ncbi:MAG TPA: hypothetical protein DC064_31160 [Cyanobacteria bacterium UBA9273]|nr:hypothetical protein [Cyanobacteria bacterium UBA9273]